MKESKTISWIFLVTVMASQVEPAKFSDISQIADGINHAVPTHKELQSSIGWLVDNNLIIKIATNTFCQSLDEVCTKLLKIIPHLSRRYGIIWIQR